MLSWKRSAPEVLSIDRKAHDKRQRVMVEVLDRAVSSGNVVRIDPARALCGAERCVAEADGKPLYNDDSHVSTNGSLFLYPMIERELDRLLAGRRLTNGSAGDGPSAEASGSQRSGHALP